MNLLLPVLFLLNARISEASVPVQIRNDKDACAQGHMSMDVKVEVKGESFNFDPSCRFSFNESFKTKEGITCSVDAGMCSAFSPKNKIEVHCDDGGRDSVKVDCPQK